MIAQDIWVPGTMNRRDAFRYSAGSVLAAAASAPSGTGAGGGETEEWSLEGWLESLSLQDVIAAALRTSEV